MVGTSNLKREIWILSDSKASNLSQSFGLASRIGIPIIQKNVVHNIFANLPNTFLGSKLFSVNKKLSDDISSGPYPLVVISSGRRTAPVALHIKKQSPQTKLVQILKPNLPTALFDLIVLPQHDRTKNQGNILYTIGAINSFDSQKNYKNEFFKNYDVINPIAVLIGGSNKSFTMKKESIEGLVQTLKSLENDNMLFVSFSRRTPFNVKDFMIKNLNAVFYDPNSNSAYNPYMGLISAAKFIIVTGDSISMLSESVSSGNPTYIYLPPDLNSEKHMYFIGQLLDIGIARRLTYHTKILEHYNYTPLCEAENVALYIKDKFLF